MVIAPALDLGLRREWIRPGKDLRNGLGDNVGTCEGGDNYVGTDEGERVGVCGGKDALVELGVTADGRAEGCGIVFWGGMSGRIERGRQNGEGSTIAGAEY